MATERDVVPRHNGTLPLRADQAGDWILVHFLAEVLFASCYCALPFALLWNSADLFAPEPTIAEAHIISISIVISLAFNGALLGLGQALAMNSRGLPTSIPLSTGLLALAWGLSAITLTETGTALLPPALNQLVAFGIPLGVLLAAAQYVIIRNSSRHRLMWALTFLIGYPAIIALVTDILPNPTIETTTARLLLVAPIAVMVVALLTALQIATREEATSKSIAA